MGVLVRGFRYWKRWTEGLGIIFLNPGKARHFWRTGEWPTDMPTRGMP